MCLKGLSRWQATVFEDTVVAYSATARLSFVEDYGVGLDLQAQRSEEVDITTGNIINASSAHGF